MTKTRSPKSINAKFGVLKRRLKTRYYIGFNCKGSYIPPGERKTRRAYVRYAWPVLFPTRELAEQAMDLLPIFANSDKTADRGRIVSASVESVRLP